MTGRAGRAAGTAPRGFQAPRGTQARPQAWAVAGGGGGSCRPAPPPRLARAALSFRSPVRLAGGRWGQRARDSSWGRAAGTSWTRNKARERPKQVNWPRVSSGAGYVSLLSLCFLFLHPSSERSPPPGVRTPPSCWTRRPQVHLNAPSSRVGVPSDGRVAVITSEKPESSDGGDVDDVGVLPVPVTVLDWEHCTAPFGPSRPSRSRETSVSGHYAVPRGRGAPLAGRSRARGARGATASDGGSTTVSADPPPHRGGVAGQARGRARPGQRLPVFARCLLSITLILVPASSSTRPFIRFSCMPLPFTE